MYTVNATEVSAISKGIEFAKRHSIRLVVKNTGHDILGRYDAFIIIVLVDCCQFALTCRFRSRSTGYGSLNIWVRHLRQGITFQEAYQPSNGCSKTDWQGSAFVIRGGYTWKDVYGEAADRGVIVVGGGDPVCDNPALP